MGQRACAEPVGGFPERAMRGSADDSVDEQSAILLEGTDRLIEVVVERVPRDVLAGG